VCGVDATPDAAEVVDLHPLGDGSDHQFISDTMNERELAV